MWILFLVLFLAIGFLGLLARMLRKGKPESAREEAAKPDMPSDCCGQHAVCERDSLLSKGPAFVYYDDEELDALAGISPIDFTPEQLQQLEYVFYTLQEQDVAGWLHSLQARNIQLPIDLREEALFIVSERRNK